MRPENAAMVAYLAAHDLPEVKAKFIRHGSLSGCWRLTKTGAKWSPALAEQLNALGFKDFDDFPLTERSGNGGEFSVFARGHKELAQEKERT